MKIEYLVKNTAQYEYAKDLSFNGVAKELRSINENGNYILTFSIKNEDEASAKLLSLINSNLNKELKIKILTNESSQYFLKRLYPVVNDFEMKLRKLLRLASMLDKGDETNPQLKLIDELEEKDLGDIFSFFFTDKRFNEIVRGIFTKKGVPENHYISHQITKKQLISHIEEIEEITPWSILLGNKVPLLIKNYVNVVGSRNDVMHAHIIDSERYNSIRNLYAKLNIQVENEIAILENRGSHGKLLKDFNIKFNEIYTHYLVEDFSFDEMQEEIIDYLNNNSTREDISNKLIKDFIIKKIYNRKSFENLKIKENDEE